MKIEDKKFNINLKFYFFLKYLVKINFSDKQLVGIFKSFNTKEYQNSFIHIKECINTNSKNGLSKLNFLEQIIYEIKDEIDAKLFLFALKIFSIKNFLLELAKLKQISNAEKLLKLDPLSIEYDKITIYNPYATRVNGALLSLIFFDYLNSPKKDFIKDFSQEYMNKIINLANELKPHGLEANQIFC